MVADLAAGIVSDATIVRALVFPAAVSLFGKRNWWLPAAAAELSKCQMLGRNELSIPTQTIRSMPLLS